MFGPGLAPAVAGAGLGGAMAFCWAGPIAPWCSWQGFSTHPAVPCPGFTPQRAASIRVEGLAAIAPGTISCRLLLALFTSPKFPLVWEYPPVRALLQIMLALELLALAINA